MANPFISVDEHVQETPDVWTKRLSQSKWGELAVELESYDVSP